MWLSFPSIGKINKNKYQLKKYDKYFSIINDMNKILYYIDDKAVYDYYFYRIPKGKIYLKWIKKESLSEKDRKVRNELMLKYNISKKQALTTLNYLKKNMWR